MIECDKLHKFYEDFCKKNRSGYVQAPAQFGKLIRKIVPKSLEKQKVQSGSKRKNIYVFPSLRICRKYFEKVIGHEIDWENN